MSKKQVVVLGSTGSIGVSALDVIRRYKNQFQVVGLAANTNVEALIPQIAEFQPSVVAVGDEDASKTLAEALRVVPNRPKVLAGIDGIEQLASHPKADVVLCGMVGSRGLLPLIAAIKKGKTIGLANKESLVVAGPLIQSLSKKHKAPIIPVDSEHSALFHCLKGRKMTEVSRMILTASGGPFYRYGEDLDQITVDMALNHPTWKMGAKITIDSATLMNKGLEAIEAHYLFGIPMEKISIVIHPQSIVHSLVEYVDGSLIGQFSNPDMRLPIQYALTHPDLLETEVKPLKLEDIKRLDFALPDFSRFPCLNLALKAGKTGGTAPAVLSASNEIAVKAFLEKRLSFMGIAKLVEHVLNQHQVRNKFTLKDVLEVDAWARNEAQSFLNQKSDGQTINDETRDRAQV